MSTTINDTSSNIMSTNIATTNLMPTNIETTNKYNLEYLTNPLYQKDLNKSTKIKAGVELNKEQCSFYRKRIIALTKEMLKRISITTFRENTQRIYPISHSSFQKSG